MKKYSNLFAIIALVFASLACQAVMGGGDSLPPEQPPVNGGGMEEPPTDSPEATDVPTVPPAATDDGGTITIGGDSEFPMPDDAFNVMNVAGVVNFQTKMSLDDAMKFYVTAFTKSGYTERTILTITSEITFSMVFDGHESGKAIVIQGVDMGDGSVNINISLQDV